MRKNWLLFVLLASMAHGALGVPMQQEESTNSHFGVRKSGRLTKKTMKFLESYGISNMQKKLKKSKQNSHPSQENEPSQALPSTTNVLSETGVDLQNFLSSNLQSVSIDGMEDFSGFEYWLHNDSQNASSVCGILSEDNLQNDENDTLIISQEDLQFLGSLDFSSDAAQPVFDNRLLQSFTADNGFWDWSTDDSNPYTRGDPMMTEALLSEPLTPA